MMMEVFGTASQQITQDDGGYGTYGAVDGAIDNDEVVSEGNEKDEVERAIRNICKNRVLGSARAQLEAYGVFSQS